MLKDIRESRMREETIYSLVFDDGIFNGFSFPCDENGELKNLSEDAKRNLEWCRENADKFERANYIEKRKHRWREPASGTCKCGEKVELVNQYMGACECPKCGQWYNLFGEELLPPDKWIYPSEWE